MQETTYVYADKRFIRNEARKARKLNLLMLLFALNFLDKNRPVLHLSFTC
jgi:hypothetical protein